MVGLPDGGSAMCPPSSAGLDCWGRGVYADVAHMFMPFFRYPSAVAVAGFSSATVGHWTAYRIAHARGRRLDRLSCTMTPEVAVLLLRTNTGLKRRHLRRIAGVDHPNVRAILVHHPRCPKQVLEEYARYGDICLVSEVAAHPRIPKKLQRTLSTSTSATVRAALAENESARDKYKVCAALHSGRSF